MEGRTVFVIAHRLSTVRNSKAIMVLEKGEIIERGSHEELLEQKGRYYQFIYRAIWNWSEKNGKKGYQEDPPSAGSGTEAAYAA